MPRLVYQFFVGAHVVIIALAPPVETENGTDTKVTIRTDCAHGLSG